MSKCRPQPTTRLLDLGSSGVILSDINSVRTVRKGSGLFQEPERNVVITIPYEALRDDREVQVAFQDLVTISTAE